MSCPEFENLLLDYAELSEPDRASLDTHLAVCPACHAFLEALEGLDSQLSAACAGVVAPQRLGESVLALTRRQPAPRRLSSLPEILDFAGWGAVAALAAVLISLVGEVWQIALLGTWVGGAVLVGFALWMGLSSWAELKR